MCVVWGACLALEQLSPAVEVVVAPEGLGAAAQDMWIVALGVEGHGVRGRDAAREALPRVAGEKIGTVRLDQDDLLARVDRGRVRGRWGAYELDIDNHIVAIRGEVACLKLGRRLANTTGASGVYGGCAGALIRARRNGRERQLDNFEGLRRRRGGNGLGHDEVGPNGQSQCGGQHRG